MHIFVGKWIFCKKKNCLIYWNYMWGRGFYGTAEKDIVLDGGMEMRLERIQDALKKKKIKYQYTEEDGCGSIDFLFRGLSFHVWEYEDQVWGVETNVFSAGRSQEVEGDYEEVVSREILSWPDMAE